MITMEIIHSSTCVLRVGKISQGENWNFLHDSPLCQSGVINNFVKAQMKLYSQVNPFKAFSIKFSSSRR